MKNMNMDNEIENIMMDSDLAAQQAQDDIYLNAHPDTRNYRETFVRCPVCHQLMPYQGSALHEHGECQSFIDTPKTKSESKMAEAFCEWRNLRDSHAGETKQNEAWAKYLRTVK
ncbi:MAG: hypothetical protein A2Z70_01385 [Chloroflexi bacterium RBG_13_48_17]|nr:MAG: hypothetical protein A2Z70_01385 [Chloroflexi bacterium RBG_13_48_17]